LPEVAIIRYSLHVYQKITATITIPASLLPKISIAFFVFVQTDLRFAVAQRIYINMILDINSKTHFLPLKKILLY